MPLFVCNLLVAQHGPVQPESDIQLQPLSVNWPPFEQTLWQDWTSDNIVGFTSQSTRHSLNVNPTRQHIPRFLVCIPPPHWTLQPLHSPQSSKSHVLLLHSVDELRYRNASHLERLYKILIIQTEHKIIRRSIILKFHCNCRSRSDRTSSCYGQDDVQSIFDAIFEWCQSTVGYAVVATCLR